MNAELDADTPPIKISDFLKKVHDVRRKSYSYLSGGFVPSSGALAILLPEVPGQTRLSLAIASHEADILRRVVDPRRAGWSREASEAILALALPKRDASRASTLARKACAGSLSPAEARELEDYKHIGRFLELMQSRARLSLKKTGAA